MFCAGVAASASSGIGSVSRLELFVSAVTTSAQLDDDAPTAADIRSHASSTDSASDGDGGNEDCRHAEMMSEPVGVRVTTEGGALDTRLAPSGVADGGAASVACASLSTGAG